MMVDRRLLYRYLFSVGTFNRICTHDRRGAHDCEFEQILLGKSTTSAVEEVLSKVVGDVELLQPTGTTTLAVEANIRRGQVGCLMSSEKVSLHEQ